MRIAIDCRLIGQSGIGTFIENILIHIVKNNQNKYLLIGDINKLANYCKLPHCTCIHCAYKSFSLKEFFLFPTKEINKCDAFFTPNFNIPMGINVPIFSTIHDVVFFDTDNFSSLLKKMIIKWYILRAINISKTIFTVSNFSKERITKLFPNTKKIIVVYSAVSEQLKKYVNNHDLNTEKKGIIFLGNLKRHKGLQTLIEAIDLLADQGFHTPLTIIGKMNFRTKDIEIKKIIEKKQGEIELISNASNQQVFDIIAHSQILISPSLYEGFGLSPLEAMYLGTPAIISDIPVYKEIYKDLPVTFFHAGDAKDLAYQIKEHKKERVNVKQLIDKHYNFEKITTPIIIEEITKIQ